MQERYVASAGSNTARTVLFDELGPISWPSGVDGRALRNRFTDANPEHLLSKVIIPGLDLYQGHAVKP